MGRKDKFLRKCISCNEYKEKSELIRITKNYLNDSIIIQPQSNEFGRSVYLCKNGKCIDNAFKKNKISKFLKINVDVDIKEKIKTVLEK